MLEDNYETCWSLCKYISMLFCVNCLGYSIEWFK